MKRKPHLHVSAIIYRHLQGVNLIYVFQYTLALPEDGYKLQPQHVEVIPYSWTTAIGW